MPLTEIVSSLETTDFIRYGLLLILHSDINQSRDHKITLTALASSLAASTDQRIQHITNQKQLTVYACQCLTHCSSVPACRNGQRSAPPPQPPFAALCAAPQQQHRSPFSLSSSSSQHERPRRSHRQAPQDRHRDAQRHVPLRRGARLLLGAALAVVVGA